MFLSLAKVTCCYLEVIIRLASFKGKHSKVLTLGGPLQCCSKAEQVAVGLAGTYFLLAGT